MNQINMGLITKVLASFFFILQYGPVVGQLDTARVRIHITTLASDAMEGRLVGTSGEMMAAEYIIKSMQEAKLVPLLKNNFKQSFTFFYNPNPHSVSQNKDTLVGTNVVGYIDNGSKYTFVIGAHYDHLGHNEYNLSLDAKGKGMIHNGADDNASGVTAVLELANIYSHNKIKEPVNFIFACFSGEELGLHGSKQLAQTLSTEYPNVHL